jgi:predicted alpha/beta hydrolase
MPYNSGMRFLRGVYLMTAALLLAGPLAAQKGVSFPTPDGGRVYADLYGKGKRGEGRFNKASWAKQARELEKAGFRVLAIDFRGYGRSRGPGDKDVMSAPL